MGCCGFAPFYDTVVVHLWPPPEKRIANVPTMLVSVGSVPVSHVLEVLLETIPMTLVYSVTYFKGAEPGTDPNSVERILELGGIILSLLALGWIISSRNIELELIISKYSKHPQYGYLPKTDFSKMSSCITGIFWFTIVYSALFVFGVAGTLLLLGPNFTLALLGAEYGLFCFYRWQIGELWQVVGIPETSFLLDYVVSWIGNFGLYVSAMGLFQPPYRHGQFLGPRVMWICWSYRTFFANLLPVLLIVTNFTESDFYKDVWAGSLSGLTGMGGESGTLATGVTTTIAPTNGTTIAPTNGTSLIDPGATGSTGATSTGPVHPLTRENQELLLYFMVVCYGIMFLSMKLIQRGLNPTWDWKWCNPSFHCTGRWMLRDGVVKCRAGGDSGVVVSTIVKTRHPCLQPFDVLYDWILYDVIAQYSRTAMVKVGFGVEEGVVGRDGTGGNGAKAIKDKDRDRDRSKDREDGGSGKETDANGSNFKDGGSKLGGKKLESSKERGSGSGGESDGLPPLPPLPPWFGVDFCKKMIMVLSYHEGELKPWAEKRFRELEILVAREAADRSVARPTEPSQEDPDAPKEVGGDAPKRVRCHLIDNRFKLKVFATVYQDPVGWVVDFLADVCEDQIRQVKAE